LKVSTNSLVAQTTSFAMVVETHDLQTTACITQEFLGALNMTDTIKSAAANDAGTAPSLRESSAMSRWAFINDWKVEPQSDDRAPVFGEAASSTASPSARRSTTRRKHQAMFKEWSQDRHD
jgi:hypothetical protein